MLNTFTEQNMTSINKLTQTPTLEDNDLSVVWQNSSGRTRAITIENLRKFIQSTDPNADAFVKAELVGDELILTAHDETETRIDINILPEHSVTELNDMPKNLLSGQYLKVNDTGTGFVLTPSSELSTEILVQSGDDPAEEVNTLRFNEGTSLLIENKIATISAAPVNGADGELMKVENGKFVPSGVISSKDGSLSLSSGSVDIGPHTISSSGEGIEATNDSSGESYNFVFAGQGDDSGPVDRILGAESSIKTTEDLSLELTNHVSKLTATADVRIIKQPVTIKPVSSQTNVTMQVTDLNGSDVWTYGPFDIVIDANGDFKFIISTVLDFKIGEYLVTFLSPDGDVTLYGGVSPISGEDIVYGELPFRPFHDETLHNIKTDGDIVREIEADPDSSITVDVDDQGLLVIGGGGGDIDTSNLAKLNEPNTFTKSQTIDNAELNVKDANGDSIFNVNPGGDSVTLNAPTSVNDELTADKLNATIVDSPSGALSLKSFGQTSISIGDQHIQMQKPAMFNKEAYLYQDSEYHGSTDTAKSLMNREAVEALIPTGSDYDGEGFGVPGKTLVEDGTVVQTQITGNYRNNSDKAGNLTINVRTDDGVKNWRFYYNIPRGSISARKVYVKVDEKAGTNKTINSGETWQCEVKAGQFFDEFFWSKITDSASTFMTPEEATLLIAENNLVQADLQTRFGTGTVEINNLEFTVDSITANNINGEV